MSEADAVARSTKNPVTIDTLVQDFNALGIKSGEVLVVHSSLSRLGWVCGGPVAVIIALEEVLGKQGTLVMPAHSGDLSDPALWANPPVPEAWWPEVRRTMPAYDIDLTPTRGMGVIAETFRKRPGVLRSNHPHVSFAARGPQARYVTEHHQLNSCMGEGSPLARLYELDARVLLLGVNHGNNTSLHLAEYRAEYDTKRKQVYGAPLVVDGGQQWVEFEDTYTDSEDFERIGVDFETQTGLMQRGSVGYGEASLFRQRDVVDYAVKWMQENRRVAVPAS